MYLASAPEGTAAGYCVTLPLADYGRLGGLAGRLGVDQVNCRYIAELGVAPAHRREGIARALLQAALGDRQAQAASYLVRTLAGNLPAIRLYRSLGFDQLPDELGRYRTASAGRLRQHAVPDGYELVQQVDLTVASVTATP